MEKTSSNKSTTRHCRGRQPPPSSSNEAGARFRIHAACIHADVPCTRAFCSCGRPRLIHPSAAAATSCIFGGTSAGHLRPSQAISFILDHHRPSSPPAGRRGHLLHPLAPPATRRGHLRRTVAATSTTRRGPPPAARIGARRGLDGCG
jgi:hypothetical protein